MSDGAATPAPDLAPMAAVLAVAVGGTRVRGTYRCTRVWAG